MRENSEMKTVPRYVVIANPETKRWQLYSEELRSYWVEQGVDAAIHLVPWADVLRCKGNLDELPVFDEPALVRLESPGRDFEVTRLMIHLGALEKGEADADSWLTIPFRKGHLLRPGLQFLGFATVLRGLKQSFDARPHLRPSMNPLAIIELFDKNATLERLRKADLPCPASLEPPADVDELFHSIQKTRFPTTYVKLACSSSASGIAVLRNYQNQWSAITSVVQLEDGLYNTRRLRRSTDADLREILSFILSEGSTVQRGIPMAQIDGQNFDLRVVLVHGQISHVIFRLSSNPMTNLHLGGRRGDPERCRAAIPTRAWLDAMDHCVEVAELYPGASLGIDLLFERGFHRHYFLEANAFGDFFPEWTNSEDKTIHRTEIERTAKHWD